MNILFVLIYTIIYNRFKNSSVITLKLKRNTSLKWCCELVIINITAPKSETTLSIWEGQFSEQTKSQEFSESCDLNNDNCNMV